MGSNAQYMYLHTLPSPQETQNIKLSTVIISGDHLVQHDVTQGHEVYHNLIGQHGEEVRGHPLPEVQQKVLHLKYKYGTLVIHL